MGWSGVYINLDRSEQRRREFEDEIARVGLTGRYRRFSAVDGASLGEPPSSAGVRGCYESHLSILRARADPDWLHIAEDDATFSRFAGLVLDAISTDPSWSHFDLVFTNVRPIGTPMVTAHLCGLFDSAVQCGPSGDVTAVRTIHAFQLGRFDFVLTTGYLVNPQSSARVAQLLAEGWVRPTMAMLWPEPSIPAL